MLERVFWCFSSDLNYFLCPQLETAQEETERRLRQVAELEKERAALGEERSYLSTRLAREKEEVQRHVHTITTLNAELASVHQQVGCASRFLLFRFIYLLECLSKSL